MASAPSAATIEALEDQLNSFDSTARAEALCLLVDRAESGEIRLPPVRDEVNLHYHTFFSFNGNGWSPSRVAWEARKYGLAVAGIVDFDVLDGMEEFLSAGEITKLRTTAAIESRVFISEYSEHVINSPNEPGISYFMAAGCFQMPREGSLSAETLARMRDMARRRNVQVMERVNRHLGKVQLDYDADVLPLTPSGNATERHLLAAYDAKAREVYSGDSAGLVSFWARALDSSREEAEALLMNTPMLHEKMRSKLMKYGGVGYVAPTAETFPTIESVIQMAMGMDALPTATWLDGTSSGEADMAAMLELLASKGVVALNIIPDRNWNIKDPEEKRVKVANLAKAVQAARDIGFPICVGTEMNKSGLPFVDDFGAPELQPYVGDFLDGAFFFWGHTVLSRRAGMGYVSDWALAHFGADIRRKTEFYTRLGRLVTQEESATSLAGRDVRSASPMEILRALGAQ